MKYLLFVVLFVFSIQAQSKDPNKLISVVKDNFARVKDYQVNVRIKLDVDILKAPDSEAKIYYKQPNHIHIESNKFALLPKDGLNFSPAALFKAKFTAIYVKEDVVDGCNTSVVKLIPSDEESNVVLTTIWIDQKLKIIRKVESTTKSNGTFALYLRYDGKNNFGLPSAMEFSFNVNSDNLPKMMSNDNEESNKSKKKFTKGKVFITYFNYIINKGIPDSIFKK